ncbi:MAG: hypothetical protein U9Q03_01440 [Patescibacteria group bacterium]|nr:hypothetical protein [Patescibacteria group bacterium]
MLVMLATLLTFRLLDFSAGVMVTCILWIFVGVVGGLWPLIADPVMQQLKYLEFVQAETHDFRHQVMPYLYSMRVDAEPFGLYLSMSALLYMVNKERIGEISELSRLILSRIRQ